MLFDLFTDETLVEVITTAWEKSVTSLLQAYLKSNNIIKNNNLKLKMRLIFLRL